MNETNMSITCRFGRKLRELRTSRGLSQEGLADLCGLDRTYISSIERGQRNISLKNINLIAKTLNTTISKMFEDI